MSQLSDKQLESFQESDARINIFEGPVRAGKSFIALVRWLEFIRNGPQGPLVICGKTEDTMKRNIINPLRTMVGRSLWYQPGKREIQLYGRTIYCISANDDRAQGKIQGAEFAGALVDEATLLPESFFKMLLSRLSVEGAQLFCSTNPDSPYHWLKRDFIDRKNELDLKVFSFNIRDNPSLTDKYITDLSKEYQGMWNQRYIQGLWVVAEGAVYDFFDEDLHTVEVPPQNPIYYICGVDAGTVNPCAFSLIGYNPMTFPNMWLEKEYKYDSKVEMRQKTDYEYAQDFMRFVDGYRVDYIYMDPSATSLKQEFMRNGIENVLEAKNDVLDGIRYMGQLLSNGTFKIGKNCTETIKEIYNYLWDSKSAETGIDKPIKRNDHVLDSLRYALFTHFFERERGRGMTERDAMEMERQYGHRRFIA